MSPMYSVGESVIVEDGSKINEYVGGWVRDMQCYVGREYTIKGIYPKENGHIGYRFTEDGGARIFDERGLRPSDAGFSDEELATYQSALKEMYSSERGS